jgi:hypothetical protein
MSRSNDFLNRTFFLHQWSRSMFKKLVPVVCLLAFAAGPVFAADTTTPSSDSTPAKSTTHKKHTTHKSKKSKTTGADSSAPK